MLLRMIRFLCVGGGATLTQYAVLFALVEAARVAPTPASAIGYAAGAAVSYGANYAWTFRSARAHGQAVPRFVGMAGFGLALNTLLMALLHDAAAIDYRLAQVAATAIGLVCNYLLASRWVYTEQPPEAAASGQGRPGRA